MKERSIVSPEDQSVTFVELFFDLVFVFSITQIVSLFRDGISWLVVGQAILVFWLVWWAWTQYSWALNSADTDHPFIQEGALLATGVAFFMAVGVPGSFGDRALWFALAYALVRLIGLALYSWVAYQDRSLRSPLKTFTILSVVGLIAVIAGGILGGTLQIAFWACAILLDVIAAAVAGRLEGWNVHPEHFGERYGLFVIIALGETLIVAASQVSVAEWTAELFTVAILAVAITCTFWWSYFPHAKPALDHALEQAKGSRRSSMARDVFSLIHFPMLCGVIAYAVAVEESVAHPGHALPIAGRIALALGVVLFVGGTALAIRRASGVLLGSRILLVVVIAVVIVAAGTVSSVYSLLIALIGLMIVVAIEQRSHEW